MSQETTRRVVALCLGVLLVVAFAAFAGELSDPDIPDDAVAVVEDVDNGTITQKEFDSALQQVAAAQGASGGVPKPDDPQYAQFVDAAASDLILSRWISGEAADLGITTTDREVDQQLEQIKQQNFGSEQEFQKFLDQSGFTQEEALNRVRLTVLSQKIQDYISLKAAGLSDQQARDIPSEQVQSILALTAVGVSPDEALDVPADQVQKLVKQSNPLPNQDVETVYEQQVSQFTQPETRDVLVIVNKSKDKVEQARAELEKDDSEDNWAQVAKQFSTDPSAEQGGLQSGVQEGQGDPAFDDAVFGAEQGELVGPFKTQTGWELAEVVKINPEQVQPLDKKAARSISQQLATSAQQAAVDAFETNLEAKWRDRTFCSDELEPTPEAVSTGQSSLASRCANFEQAQMDSCAIDDPKERNQAAPEQLSQGCPPPVVARNPATPQVLSAEEQQQRQEAQLQPLQQPWLLVPGSFPQGLPQRAFVPPATQPAAGALPAGAQTIGAPGAVPPTGAAPPTGTAPPTGAAPPAGAAPPTGAAPPAAP